MPRRLPGRAIQAGTITVTQLETSVATTVQTGGGPKITNVEVTSNSYVVLDDTAVDIAGGYIKITGTGFLTGCQVLINNTPATSTTFVSATEVRAQVPASAAGSYIIYLVNPDGGVAIRINGITFSATPTWVTGSSLAGNVDEAISIQLSATGATSYVLAAGSTLPTGLTLSSGGLLSGTVTGLVNDTSYSFTITAVDAENQDSPRSFTITISANLQVARSLRFNPSDVTYFNRTPASSGNRRIWTWSGWVKLTGITDYYDLFSAYANGQNTTRILINNDMKLHFSSFVNDSYTVQLVTTQVFRDPSAWAHFVFALDTTQATASNRIKIYYNGSEITAFATATYPSQNLEPWINNANTHNIGSESTWGIFNGYMTEVYFIDGQALTPSTFAKTDTTTGQWIPKRYTGTYGTNGYYLNFADNSNTTAATLGKDSSGNNNNFTPNSFRLSQSSVYWSRYFTYGNGSGIVPNARIFDGTTTNGGASVNGVTQNFVPPTPISYNTLEVLFGNGNNIGSPGAPLSLNGVVVQSAPAGSGGATSTYTTNTPGILTSLSVGGGVSGQYESNIYKIKIDGRYLTDPIYSASSIDSPTNYGTDSGLGGEVRGNYATLNPLALGSYASLGNGSLGITGTTATNSGGSLATIGVATGKWYFEFTVTSTTSSFGGVVTYYTNNAVLNDENNVYGASGSNKGIGIRGSGSVYGNASEKQTIAAFTYGTSDIIGVAIDADNGAVYFRVNNTWLNSGVPTSGASRTGSFHNWTPAADRVCYPALVAYNGQAATANFGQRPFAYAAPSGFKSLNTHNLPALAVAKSNTAFDTVLYTGDGTNSRTITSSLSFTPDFVWGKSRSIDQWHVLVDSVRGNYKTLCSNATNAESPINSYNLSTANSLITWNSNETNQNGTTYAAWLWKANGAGSTNTVGSITSTISVNTTSGFSIVSWTGTGANATVGHGLNAVPGFIIVRNRDTVYNWRVWHTALSGTQLLYLNTTDATVTDATMWNSTIPTSTVFSLGTNGGVNESTKNIIAYCFAAVPGFSAFGTYTGNGSADGPFVYTGFRPALIIAKQSSGAGQNWYIIDNKRGSYNVVDKLLNPNSSAIEETYSQVDFLSNGFKIRNTGLGMNASSATMIYAAFAESPFKYARAR
jgi:hypothetical protein